MKCRFCNRDCWIHSDGETVCSNCGYVSEEKMAVRTGHAPASQVMIHEEKKLGSRKLIDEKIQLKNINRRRTEQIISRNDSRVDDFGKICSDMGLPSNVARDAFFMFERMRKRNLGNGKLAVFCIVHSSMKSGYVYDESKLFAIIRSRFNLKRPLSMSKAIYRVKPVAIEMGLIDPNIDYGNFLIKKFINPKNRHKAMKMMGVVCGSEAKKLRDVEKILNAYS